MAGFLGLVSSSCSYAAAALAKSLFARGADFTSAMAFMFASTNLVVELGIVLWLLMGWQFALAQFAGGTLMIVLLSLVLPWALSRDRLATARARLNGTNGSDADSGEHHTHDGHDTHDGHCRKDDDDPDVKPSRRSAGQHVRRLAGWSDAAGYTISDLTMLRKELGIGFVVAGFATVVVPIWVWQSLFVTGHGAWSSAENVLLGPLLALLAFVCSVGNVPLAAALWAGGISFGGVIAFIFGDLITVPLLFIYRRYYGTPITLRLLAVFWAVMSMAGLVIEYLFAALDLVPHQHRGSIPDRGLSWNYTTWLNILALTIFVGLYWLHRNRDRFGGGIGYATDPVCGMQVEQASAPAIAVRAGQVHYFCSDRCHTRFTQQPGQA
jgi:hypothetical protein